MAKQTYTLDKAERALPLIGAIARDLHETYLRMRSRLADLGHDVPLQRIETEADLPEDVRELLTEIRGLGRELRELGVTLEDPELGLVSFRGLVEGLEVNLCWKIGETEVRSWYALGASYEDRRPLPVA